MLTIVDYGMGNHGSIFNMLRKIGGDAKVTSKIEDLRNAERIILPGVGAFDNGVRNLGKNGLTETLREIVIQEKRPVLGICLGMQLMTKFSEEGILPGLGWIDAKTVRFRFERSDNPLKIPHMGWNTVSVVRENALFKDINVHSRFYFVHSYHAVVHDESDILTKTRYGYDFVSSFQRENIMGVQFHPEKSHKYGMALLKNFLDM
jgi:glutamine amidotransferase